MVLWSCCAHEPNGYACVHNQLECGYLRLENKLLQCAKDLVRDCKLKWSKVDVILHIDANIELIGYHEQILYLVVNTATRCTMTLVCVIFSLCCVRWELRSARRHMTLNRSECISII